jgi:hypothetical protein
MIILTSAYNGNHQAVSPHNRSGTAPKEVHNRIFLCALLNSAAFFYTDRFLWTDFKIPQESHSWFGELFSINSWQGRAKRITRPFPSHRPF